MIIKIKYSNLTSLSDVNLRRLLNHVDNKCLLSALGADEISLIPRLRKLLSARALVAFDHDLAKTKNLEASSVEEARQQIEKIAAQLIELKHLKTQ